MRPVRDLDEEIVRVLFEQSRQAGSGVLVAVHGYGDASEIVGGGRYVRTQRPTTSEFAMTVIDSWQGRGLGTMLLHALQHDARARGHHRMIGYVLSENAGMLSIAARAGMRVQRLPEDPSVCIVSRTLLWLSRPAIPVATPRLAARPPAKRPSRSNSQPPASSPRGLRPHDPAGRAVRRARSSRRSPEISADAN
jgi:GNAT superfamily N-acetyltransferase